MRILAAVLALAASACSNGGQSNEEIRDIEVSVESLIPVGSTSQATVFAVYSDGSRVNVTSETTWDIADPTIVAVNEARFTGLIRGATTVRATVNGVNRDISVVVTNAIPVDLIANFVPETPLGIIPTVPVGTTLEVSATVRLSDGQTIGATTMATWEGDYFVAIIEPGAVKGLAVGYGVVTAKLLGLSSVLPIQVTPATPVSLHIMGPTNSLMVGETLSLFVCATLSDGADKDVSGDALISSAVNGVVQITGNRITGLARGTTEIIVTYGPVGLSFPLVVE